MRNEIVFRIIFSSVLIISMIAARRLFGEWADGVFIVAVALTGIVFWLFKATRKYK
ncbi:hypothetical protein [Methylovulum psychrotolerans]|uniref:hypothetical protein n=1 Tax=Methylovulum psychrotolerans TaxID=1704499 RepID=UPI001472CE18|nr:hypothetical protein [Methylovulum psychrotolerans]